MDIAIGETVDLFESYFVVDSTIRAHSKDGGQKFPFDSKLHFDSQSTSLQ